MAARLSWLSRALSGPGIARALLAQLRLTLRLLRDPAVPMLLKGVPVLAGLYLLSPIDLVPDILPLLGQLDDLGLVVLALQAFLTLCPSSAVEHHRSALADGRPFSPADGGGRVDGGRVIDAEFRRHDAAR
ncbi:MAG: DUF1232 domain-containing protein [Vicinamibacterales bacterium]